VFIGNLETYEVYTYELNNSSAYVSTLDLPNGYYVIYGNGFSWSDAEGMAYAVNGGESQYVYIGDAYDSSLYGVEFEYGNEFFNIKMAEAPANMQQVGYNSELILSDSDLVFPEELKIERVPEPTSPTEPSETQPNDDPEKPEYKFSLWKMLLNIFKKHILMFIAIAGCGVGLLFIKAKKKAEAAKQIESDLYDDKRID
jgi:hypothetical protein